MTKYTYDYPMFSIATDIVVLDDNRNILLIKRKNDPHKGKYCPPGGFVEIGELILYGAERELFEETNLKVCPSDLFSIMVLDDVDRDSRGRVISHVFLTTVPDLYNCGIKAGDDAESIFITNIFDLDLSTLGFDHAKVIEYVKNNLIWNIRKN